MKRAALIFSFLLTGCVTTPSDPLIEPSSSITGSLSQHDGCYWLTTPDGSEREVVAAAGARIVSNSDGQSFVGTDSSTRKFGVSGSFIGGEGPQKGACINENVTVLYRTI